ncbi:MAG TPA: adenylate cyclase regulatory domain-containing protein [Thermoleophilaceae bacterium]
MAEAIDFEAEGLLQGVEGEEREARRQLLEELVADGASLDELKRAVAEDRLAFLPLERLLAGEGKYTPAEVAERSGLSHEFQDQLFRALGLALAEPDEAVYTDADVEAARTINVFLDAGFSEETVLEVCRVLGDSMARVAATISDVAVQTLGKPGDTERDFGLRYVQITRALEPELEPLILHVLNLHERERAKRVVVSRADIAAGSLGGSTPIAVCFADLVDFTRLGEDVDAVQLGQVAGRLTDLALEAAVPPVRLVKTIGDAVMLVSPRETDPLLDTALSLLERCSELGEDFPQLRVGMAYGEGLGRAGDWYGRPVNLASRVTAYARPGAVLATNEVREEANGDYSWSKAGIRRFKGIKEPVGLLRVRRPSQETSEADARD